MLRFCAARRAGDYAATFHFWYFFAVLTLFFKDFEPQHSYHAALISFRSSSAPESRLHDHADFAEFMLVTAGAGTHEVNGTSVGIERGALTLVRPRDRHLVLPAPGGALEFINIAFPVDLAIGILEAAGVSAARWFSAADTPLVRLAENDMAELQAVYLDILHRRLQGPSPLDLMRLLATSLARWPEEPSPGAAATPVWLHSALVQMRDEENLRRGMDALRELTRVSPSHLSREVRRHTGQTPGQWLTAARLRLARTLLATTTDPVESIAQRVGFDSASYFGKRFRAATGLSASEYRRQRVAGVLGSGSGR